MKNDWLKDIHDRMADFEVDVPQGSDQREQPQGLWEDICSAENLLNSHPVEKQTQISSTGKKTAYKIGGWSAVAAACMLFWWFLHPDPEAVHEKGISSVHEQKLAAEAEKPMEVAEKMENTTCIRSYFFQNGKTEIVSSTAPDSVATVMDSDATVMDSDVLPTKTIKPVKRNTERRKRHQYLAQRSRKEGMSQRFSVGISSSGGVDSNSRQLFQGGYAEASTTIDDTEWKDSPLLGIMYLNRGMEIEKKASHHAPIRTRLSFSYQINDRWSIESGISYAKVSSDFQEGSAANYILEEQTLHYVGIPLGVSFRMFTWENLDLYLSSDVLAEQCVAGDITRNFIIGDQTQQEANPIKSRPLQMSIGAQAGLQYNLNSTLAIYAEPGCRFYFDDQSSIETVFKDKKFDFNLNIGVRIMVGK